MSTKIRSALLFSAVCVGMLLSSCKKKDGPSGGTVIGSTTTAQNGDPSGTYNGFLVSLYFTIPSFTISTGVANFYATPRVISVNSNGTGNTTVSSVFMNNVKFKLDPTGPSYGDTTNVLVFPPATWNVTGGGTIPSFTYTNTNALPVYGGAGIPTTVIRSQDLTIPITGASGYDQVLVTIDDGGNGLATAAPSTATSVTFVKDSLAKLAACTGTANIYVALIKYNPQTFSGKNFMFSTIYYYTRQGVSIN